MAKHSAEMVFPSTGYGCGSVRVVSPSALSGDRAPLPSRIYYIRIIRALLNIKIFRKYINIVSSIY